MSRRDPHTFLDTLGLAGDGDDIDLLREIEASFGVAFDDEAGDWRTVGDLYWALVRRVGTDEAGLCATSMAFYALRGALERQGRTEPRARPTSRLATLARLPPRRQYALLARELGLKLPAPPSGRAGTLGLCLCLAAAPGAVVALVQPALWPWLAAGVAAGVALLRLDPGAYGQLTLGDLARETAARNNARFVAKGADTRHEAVWRALRDLLAADGHQNVGLETRLIA